MHGCRIIYWARTVYQGPRRWRKLTRSFQQPPPANSTSDMNLLPVHLCSSSHTHTPYVIKGLWVQVHLNVPYLLKNAGHCAQDGASSLANCNTSRQSSPIPVELSLQPSSWGPLLPHFTPTVSHFLFQDRQPRRNASY